jgi:hypothetical protein
MERGYIGNDSERQWMDESPSNEHGAIDYFREVEKVTHRDASDLRMREISRSHLAVQAGARRKKIILESFSQT